MFLSYCSLNVRGICRQIGIHRILRHLCSDIMLNRCLFGRYSLSLSYLQFYDKFSMYFLTFFRILVKALQLSFQFNYFVIVIVANNIHYFLNYLILLTDLSTCFPTAQCFYLCPMFTV
jgi:hypothetical protein